MPINQLRNLVKPWGEEHLPLQDDLTKCADVVPKEQKKLVKKHIWSLVGRRKCLFWRRPDPAQPPRTFGALRDALDEDDLTYTDLAGILQGLVTEVARALGGLSLYCPSGLDDTDDQDLFYQAAVFLLGASTPPPGGVGVVYCPSLRKEVPQNQCPDFKQ